MHQVGELADRQGGATKIFLTIIEQVVLVISQYLFAIIVSKQNMLKNLAHCLAQSANNDSTYPAVSGHRKQSRSK